MTTTEMTTDDLLEEITEELDGFFGDDKIHAYCNMCTASAQKGDFITALCGKTKIYQAIVNCEFNELPLDQICDACKDYRMCPICGISGY